MQRVGCLVRLTIGQFDARDSLAGQIRLEFPEVQRCDGFVADDQAVTADDVRFEVEAAAQQPCADDNRVAAKAEFDVDGVGVFHGWVDYRKEIAPGVFKGRGHGPLPRAMREGHLPGACSFPTSCRGFRWPPL
jgi:hypothetical protein